MNILTIIFGVQIVFITIYVRVQWLETSP